ncbi:hypothetical protein QAD02_005029 [Eretmocerus hayati]|uniref:Uncharacterized protein n=1 Tax=Eretmocerus hayati TaxID=131215 RepID=A0ACC2NU51_9HYME|nr:hypothetical protein QAD02_005029 [Eretmocerus hayati]
MRSSEPEFHLIVKNEHIQESQWIPIWKEIVTNEIDFCAVISAVRKRQLAVDRARTPHLAGNDVRERPAPAYNQQEREKASGTGVAVQGEDGFDDADSSDDPDGEQQFGAGAHTSGIQQLPASSRSRPIARPSQTQDRPRSPINDGTALQGPGAMLANQLPVPPKRGRGRPPAAARPGVNVAAPNIHNQPYQPPVARKRRVRYQDLAPALQIQPPQFDQQHLQQVKNHQLREQSLPSQRRQNRRGERERDRRSAATRTAARWPRREWIWRARTDIATATTTSRTQTPADRI